VKILNHSTLAPLKADRNETDITTALSEFNTRFFGRMQTIGAIIEESEDYWEAKIEIIGS
jgi:hypothetical protein